MPKFLIEASYTPEGLRGLAKDKASGRQAAVSEALVQETDRALAMKTAYRAPGNAKAAKA